MTGVILNVVNTVKNFFWGRDDHRGALNNGAAGPPPRLFSLAGHNPRKRPANTHILELEITDDEEENSVGGAKRYKVREDRFFDMSEEDSNRRRATRGSGIPPTIEGRAKQPWEFNFDFANTRKNPTSSVEYCRGSFLGQSTSREAAPGPSGPSASHQGRAQTDFSNFRFRKTPTTEEGVEVITLDGEGDKPPVITVEDKNGDKRRGRSPSKDFLSCFRRHDHNGGGGGIFKSKPFKPQKQHLSSMLGSVGNKFVDPVSTTIRLEERNSYKKLIQHMSSNIKPFNGLRKSKVDQDTLKATYQNWSSPKVSFTSIYAPLSTSTPISDRVKNDLKLFSTPTASRSSGSTPIGPTTPLLIDIEEEERQKSLNNATPTEQGRKNGGLMNQSFLDLEDALNKSKINGGRRSRAESTGSGASSAAEEDPDITILSESILRKSRDHRINSLALEQNLSPYVQPNWLNGLSSSWRENQREREKEIADHLETVDVLQKESTLEKDLRERIRDRLSLTEFIVLEEPELTIPEITEEMMAIINLAKRPGREDEVLAQVFNIDFTRGDVKTLGPCKWLNDNVVNLYMELIAQRSKVQKSGSTKLPKVHVFTTFFYPKLLKEGYSNPLKRWTRKVDIFSHDLILFPIHLGLHWCLACADLRDKSIKYYDSLGGTNDKCLHALLNYLSLEMKERKGELLRKEEWLLENVADIPQQQNGSDCGVFSCKFAEYLSRDSELTFTQENMNYYRDRMIYEIIKKDLLFP